MRNILTKRKDEICLICFRVFKTSNLTSNWLPQPWQHQYPHAHIWSFLIRLPVSVATRSISTSHGWDASPSQGPSPVPSIKFASTHLSIWVERGTVRVEGLAQEHNIMSPARAWTWPTRSGGEPNSRKAITPRRNLKCLLTLSWWISVFFSTYYAYGWVNSGIEGLSTSQSEHIEWRIPVILWVP